MVPGVCPTLVGAKHAGGAAHSGSCWHTSPAQHPGKDIRPRRGDSVLRTWRGIPCSIHSQARRDLARPRIRPFPVGAKHRSCREDRRHAGRLAPAGSRPERGARRHASPLRHTGRAFRPRRRDCWLRRYGAARERGDLARPRIHPFPVGAKHRSCREARGVPSGHGGVIWSHGRGPATDCRGTACRAPTDFGPGGISSGRGFVRSW